MVQEISSGCKNFNNQARSHRPKTKRFWVCAPSHRSKFWEHQVNLGISKSSGVHHFHSLNNTIKIGRILPHITKIFQNFWFTQVINLILLCVPVMVILIWQPKYLIFWLLCSKIYINVLLERKWERKHGIRFLLAIYLTIRLLVRAPS